MEAYIIWPVCYGINRKIHNDSEVAEEREKKRCFLLSKIYRLLTLAQNPPHCGYVGNMQNNGCKVIICFLNTNPTLLQQLQTPLCAASSLWIWDESQLLSMKHYLLPFQLHQDFVLLCCHGRGSSTLLQVFQNTGDHKDENQSQVIKCLEFMHGMGAKLFSEQL